MLKRAKIWLIYFCPPPCSSPSYLQAHLSFPSARSAGPGAQRLFLLLLRSAQGGLCQCVSWWDGEKWGRWWQFISTWEARGSTPAEGGEAEQDASLRIFLRRAGRDETHEISPPLHQTDRREDKQREDDWDKGKGLFFFLQDFTPSFSLRNSPQHQSHFSPQEILMTGSTKKTLFLSFCGNT